MESEITKGEKFSIVLMLSATIFMFVVGCSVLWLMYGAKGEIGDDTVIRQNLGEAIIGDVDSLGKVTFTDDFSEGDFIDKMKDIDMKQYDLVYIKKNIFNAGDPDYLLVNKKTNEKEYEIRFKAKDSKELVKFQLIKLAN